MNRFLAAASLLAFPAALNAQIFTWTDRGDDQNNPWMASMVAAGFTPQDDAAMVAKLSALPAGKRCLFLWDQNHSVFSNDADGTVIQSKVYWPNGIADAHAMNARVIAALSAANVKPDVVLLDNEDAANSYNMTAAQMLLVASDPHVSNLDWPTLPLVSRADQYQFDTVMTTVERAALHEGVLADFEQYAPDALTCNFAERTCTPSEAQAAPDIMGNPYAMPTLSGNAQAPGMYLFATSYAPTRTAYGLSMYGTNVLRTSIRHSQVLPWYGSENVDQISIWNGTGYWEEFLRHGMLTCGVQGMLFDANDNTAAARVSTVVYDLMKACNGTLPQTLVTTDLAVTNAQWYASARVDTDANNKPTRIVARVTFAPGVTKAHVIISGKTFDVTRPARKVGTWIQWNAATASPKLY